jgi:protein-tyrosine phosphatase
MKILLVCLGNICRSPMAEGILRHMARARDLDWTIDSAGTSGHHAGEAPDRRAQQAMAQRGMDISGLRSRPVRPADLDAFDLLLAMDRSNLEDLMALALGPEHAGKIKLIMDLVPGHPLREVPDPWYGGPEGFDQVHDMLASACAKLIADARG